MSNRIVTVPLEEYQELVTFKKRMEDQHSLVYRETITYGSHRYRDTIVKYISQDKALKEISDLKDENIKQLEAELEKEQKRKKGWFT